MAGCFALWTFNSREEGRLYDAVVSERNAASMYQWICSPPVFVVSTGLSARESRGRVHSGISKVALLQRRA